MQSTITTCVQPLPIVADALYEMCRAWCSCRATRYFRCAARTAVPIASVSWCARRIRCICWLWCVDHLVIDTGARIWGAVDRSISYICVTVGIVPAHCLRTRLLWRVVGAKAGQDRTRGA
jgi:hypothetical protein